MKRSGEPRVSKPDFDFQNPPAGSAARRAMDFGIDLSITYRNMFELSMSDRLNKLEQHLLEAQRRRKSTLRSLGKIQPKLVRVPSKNRSRD
jgi:hypothetical protein